jgi:hypothetical protein
MGQWSCSTFSVRQTIPVALEKAKKLHQYIFRIFLVERKVVNASHKKQENAHSKVMSAVF